MKSPGPHLDGITKLSRQNQIGRVGLKCAEDQFQIGIRGLVVSLFQPGHNLGELYQFHLGIGICAFDRKRCTNGFDRKRCNNGSNCREPGRVVRGTH